MSVEKILREKGSDVVTAKPSTKIADIVGTLAEKKIGVIVISDDESHVAGILSERDIVRAFGRFGAKAAQVTVGDIATRNVTACVTETSLARVQSLMKEGGFRHMPVVEEGRVKGIISIGDILGYQARREQQAAE